MAIQERTGEGGQLQSLILIIISKCHGGTLFMQSSPSGTELYLPEPQSLTFQDVP